MNDDDLTYKNNGKLNCIYNKNSSNLDDIDNNNNSNSNNDQPIDLSCKRLKTEVKADLWWDFKITFFLVKYFMTKINFY